MLLKSARLLICTGIAICALCATPTQVEAGHLKCLSGYCPGSWCAGGACAAVGAPCGCYTTNIFTGACTCL